MSGAGLKINMVSFLLRNFRFCAKLCWAKAYVPDVLTTIYMAELD